MTMHTEIANPRMLFYYIGISQVLEHVKVTLMTWLIPRW